MKCLLAALALVSSLACVAAELPVPRQFRKGDVWVAVGDSITHSRRYHSFIYLYYATRFPGQRFEAVNCGVSGGFGGGRGAAVPVGHCSAPADGGDRDAGDE